MIIVKSRIVRTRDGGFAAYAVKTDTGAKFRIGAAGWSPGTQAMYNFGQFGIDLIKKRVAKGIGSDGAPMPPLKAVYNKDKTERGGYKAFKRRIGLNPIRDLTGPHRSDHMLANLSVRFADESSVRMEFTSNSARTKARRNERRAPWFGWSPQDLLSLNRRAGSIFGDFVARATFRNSGSVLRAAAAHPWLSEAA
jgi:hypothetical protein